MSGIKGANAGEKCARYVHGETNSCGAKMDEKEG